MHCLCPLKSFNESHQGCAEVVVIGEEGFFFFFFFYQLHRIDKNNQEVIFWPIQGDWKQWRTQKLENGAKFVSHSHENSSTWGVKPPMVSVDNVTSWQHSNTHTTLSMVLRWNIGNCQTIAQNCSTACVCVYVCVLPRRVVQQGNRGLHPPGAAVHMSMVRDCMCDLCVMEHITEAEEHCKSGGYSDINPHNYYYIGAPVERGDW